MQNMKRMRLGFWAAVVLTLTVSAAWGQGYTRPELLIETEELARLLERSDSSLRLIDAVDPGSYGRAHIPGAVNIFKNDLTRIEARKKNGYPITVEDAEKIFGEAGINKETLVVAYDGGEGPSASAIWFVLEFFGHKNVKVLNGGLRKWMKEGRPVTQDVPEVEKKTFTAEPHPDKVVTLAWMKKNLRSKDADTVVVDTRSFKEFIGEETQGGAARGGHIPGAVHIEWKKFSDRNSPNTFKSAEQIKKVLAKRGVTKDTKIITYCNSGVGRSTDVALVLKLIGYNVSEFTGSWQEWSSDPRLPIEK